MIEMLVQFIVWFLSVVAATVVGSFATDVIKWGYEKFFKGGR
jgi:hypothetical protein